MNYLSIYKSIIRRAKSQQRKKLNRLDSNYVYYESHHIIPKSFLRHKSDKIVNGSWNRVLLTAREHFICHRLLVKICETFYGKNHNFTIKMIYSLNNFITRKSYKNCDYKITANTYEYLKKQKSDFQSTHLKKLYKTGKIKSYWKGRKGPMFGKKFSDESKKKMSISHLGNPGAKWSDEAKEKMRLMNIGDKNPMFGKKYKMEQTRKDKIGRKNKNRTYYSSPDLKEVRAIKYGDLPPNGWIKGNATKFKEETRKHILNSINNKTE